MSIINYQQNSDALWGLINCAHASKNTLTLWSVMWAKTKELADGCVLDLSVLIASAQGHNYFIHLQSSVSLSTKQVKWLFQSGRAFVGVTASDVYSVHLWNRHLYDFSPLHEESFAVTSSLNMRIKVR